MTLIVGTLYAMRSLLVVHTYICVKFHQGVFEGSVTNNEINGRDAKIHVKKISLPKGDHSCLRDGISKLATN